MSLAMCCLSLTALQTNCAVLGPTYVSDPWYKTCNVMVADVRYYYEALPSLASIKAIVKARAVRKYSVRPRLVSLFGRIVLYRNRPVFKLFARQNGRFGCTRLISECNDANSSAEFQHPPVLHGHFGFDRSIPLGPGAGMLSRSRNVCSFSLTRNA